MVHSHPPRVSFPSSAGLRECPGNRWAATNPAPGPVGQPGHRLDQVSGTEAAAPFSPELDVVAFSGLRPPGDPFHRDPLIRIPVTPVYALGTGVLCAMGIARCMTAGAADQRRRQGHGSTAVPDPALPGMSAAPSAPGSGCWPASPACSPRWPASGPTWGMVRWPPSALTATRRTDPRRPARSTRLVASGVQAAGRVGGSGGTEAAAGRDADEAAGQESGRVSGISVASGGGDLPGAVIRRCPGWSSRGDRRSWSGGPRLGDRTGPAGCGGSVAAVRVGCLVGGVDA